MENINLQPTLMAPLSGAEIQEESVTFIPKGVCAKMIRYSLDGNKLAQVSFTGGCDGNLKAISALVKGMEIDEIIEKLSGITCGRKNTSCADQLCCALREHQK